MSQSSSINVRVSEDKLEAYIGLRFNSKKTKPSLAVLETALNSEGITFGIIYKELSRLVESPSASEILVAQGKKAKKSTPSYIKVKKRLFNSRPPIEAHGQIDFKMVTPFIMVKKGEPLAQNIPPTEGEEGRSVFDEPIAPEKKSIEQVQAGENVIEKEGVFYALKAGRFELENNEFRINEVLEIAGDVDYSTGHISFPGDVIIGGQIKDGFRVAAGGSIHCKETLDASEVFTKKNLIIEGGIIGKNKGLIRAQGKVETKFIEHCKVESLSGLSVKSSIVDSDINTLGELVLLKNGKLIGGTIYAEKGITAHKVGSPSNGHINLFLGISFVEARHLSGEERILIEIMEKKKKIKSIANEEKREELSARADEAIERLQGKIGTQMVKQYTDYEATLTVTGEIQPGAVVTICDKSHVVNEVHKSVIFYYDKENQQVNIKKFKKE